MPRIELTDRFVAGAKSNGTVQVDYFDAKTPGLALRLSSTRKAWTYLYTSPRDGKRARITLGTYPALSLAKARGLAIGARQQVEDGVDPRGQSFKGTAELSFADLARLYLADPDKAKLRSIREIKRRLDRNALPIIGAIRLAKLTRRDVRDVTEPIMRRRASVQAEHTFKDIRAVLRWGVKNEYLDTNPIDGMEKPGGSTPGERVLSDDEIRTLWTGLPKALAKSKTCQRIIKLCLITGQRLGEVAGMARSELDLDRKLWSLPGSRTKNGHPHIVPLSDLAIGIIGEALADIPRNCEFLFRAEDGGPLPSPAVTRSITRAHETSEDRPLGRFGLAPWSAHDLRRSALTNMAKLGISPHVIAHVANHRSITKSGVTFAHYVVHSYEAEKRQALDVWAERLGAIVAGKAANVVPLREAAK